jgi:hypothetical protein
MAREAPILPPRERFYVIGVLGASGRLAESGARAETPRPLGMKKGSG